MDVDKIRDWIELSLIPGIGSKTFLKLLDHFGSARAALQASAPALGQVPDLGKNVIQAIQRGCKSELDKSLRLVEKHNVSVVAFNDQAYPDRLKHVHAPPPLLYIKGSLRPVDANSISIVGSRRATPYGKMVAGRLAGDLAKMGITVVSGLAYGIDAAAHKGALSAAGRTIAVLGCGVDVIYPRANAKIYEQIPESGAVISEFPMGCQPDAGLFPMRNRIVSGLSLGTLVVEAPKKSGALITARHAMEQGREVLAVPGNIYSPYAEGCHKLIKDGAKLVENVYDIIEEIQFGLTGIEANDRAEIEQPAQPLAPMTESEKKVFNLLSMVPVHIDEVTEETNLSASDVASSLMTLELKGLVLQLPGKHFIRKV